MVEKTILETKSFVIYPSLKSLFISVFYLFVIVLLISYIFFVIDYCLLQNTQTSWSHYTVLFGSLKYTLMAAILGLVNTYNNRITCIPEKYILKKGIKISWTNIDKEKTRIEFDKRYTSVPPPHIIFSTEGNHIYINRDQFDLKALKELFEIILSKPKLDIG